MIKLFSEIHYNEIWFQSISRFINHIRQIIPEHLWNGFREWDYSMVLHYTGLFGNGRKKVLDAGCGWSIFPLILRALGHEVTTIDFNFADRLNNRQLVYGYNDIKNYDGDLADTEFMVQFKNSFDVVSCISIIEHVYDADIILNNLKNCLVPTGVIGLTFDFTDNEDIENVTQDPIYQAQVNKYSAKGKLITKAGLQEMIDKAGYEIQLGDLEIKERVSYYTLGFLLLI